MGLWFVMSFTVKQFTILASKATTPTLNQTHHHSWLWHLPTHKWTISSRTQSLNSQKRPNGLVIVGELSECKLWSLCGNVSELTKLTRWSLVIKWWGVDRDGCVCYQRIYTLTALAFLHSRSAFLPTCTLYTTQLCSWSKRMSSEFIW